MPANEPPAADPAPLPIHHDPARCRCGRNAPVRLRGKAQSAKKGLSLVMAFRCRSWRCAGCRRWNEARWSAHVRKCVLAWADPSFLKPIDTPLPDGRPVAGDEPWQLAMGVINPDQFSAVSKSISRRRCGQTGKRAEFAAIQTRVELVTDGQGVRVALVDTPPYSNSDIDIDQSDEPTRLFLVVAVPPGSTVPDGLVPATPAEAVTATNEAIRHIPDATSIPDKPFRPCRTSYRWKLPPQERSEFDREGTSALPTDQVRQVLIEVGGEPLSGEDNTSGVEGGVAYRDESLGGELVGWLFGQLLEPREDGTGRSKQTVVSHFLSWKHRLAGLPVGQSVCSELLTRLDFPADDSALCAVLVAADSDRRNGTVGTYTRPADSIPRDCRNVVFDDAIWSALGGRPGANRTGRDDRQPKRQRSFLPY